MSNKKKEVRRKFREVCLKRDKLTCVMCGLKAKSVNEAEQIFDIHHITDRSEMPSGGFVLENGITLCKDDCHLKAEEYHSTGIAFPGYSVDELYEKIGSSLAKAIEASKLLK